jgi:hypothetical protein
MLNRFRGRLTYANVVATLALFVALGGMSYAAVTLPANSVGQREIKRNGVGKSEIAPGAVGRSELGGGAVSDHAISQQLASDLQQASSAFVPPNNATPCQDFGGSSACVTVSGSTKSLGFLKSTGWQLTCPSTAPHVVYKDDPYAAFSVVTHSDHYSGIDSLYNSGTAEQMGVTNWSTTTHSFTPYIGCEP